jgi:hypothetical protein
VFIRHRTQEEIEEANKVNVASLRDPQTDEDRVKKPEWLVMLGTSLTRHFLSGALALNWVDLVLGTGWKCKCWVEC